MKNVITIIASVAICFLVGFLGAQAQQFSLESWYPMLHKSPLTPPNILFPIVWSILYLFMGISIGLILISKTKNKRFFVLLFVAQILLNGLWSILFFKMQNPLLGFIDILLLDILVLWYTIASYRKSPLSSLLFWPYAAWILFATYLNFYILLYN